MDDLNIYEKIGWAVTWTPCRRLYNRAPCRLVAHGWVECNNRHKLILAGRPTTFGSTIVHCSFVRCRAGEIFVDFTKEQINRGPLLLFSLASLNSSPPSFSTLDNLLIGLGFDFFLRSKEIGFEWRGILDKFRASAVSLRVSLLLAVWNSWSMFHLCWIEKYTFRYCAFFFWIWYNKGDRWKEVKSRSWLFIWMMDRQNWFSLSRRFCNHHLRAVNFPIYRILKVLVD